MRPEALFINGVFETVFTEILQIQATLPEEILFLQPYSGDPIVRLRDNPPTVDDPVRLFASVTTDLPTVRYAAEIVGWEDKRTLPPDKRACLNRIIASLQPKEGSVYDASRVEGSPSVNLLHIRRLVKLAAPFGVQELVKTTDGTQVSPGRTTAGGWVYIKNPK